MNITGKNLIGDELSAAGSETFRGYNPLTLQELEEIFFEGTPEEVNRVMDQATEAFRKFRTLPGIERAQFLEAIVGEIEALGDELIHRVEMETGLPKGRLEGERARTTGQIRMFANQLREGSWVEATIDPALPGRTPLPRPDLRRMLVPLGPVVVFAAGNFPLAFSVAGGDTISALAAGNPVVVKAHPGHPGTSELVGRAVIRAARSTGMPGGVFSLVHGNSHSPGNKLVLHPGTRAVAFTGSFQGGKSLFDLAAVRSEPIPVFAEMGSINPVFILDRAIENRSAEIASQLAGSVHLSVGQFCTRPGIIVVTENRHLNSFLESLEAAFSEKLPEAMLSIRISKNYHGNIQRLETGRAVKFLYSGRSTGRETDAIPSIASISAEDFMKDPSLQEEIFGPFSLVIVCRDQQQMLQLAEKLQGQLTVTLMAGPGELDEYGDLTAILQQKAGRFICNGVPTGVEVAPSMHHGGPFPATTDPRFTSVGTAAMKRFVRPVCYQNWPEHLLPGELRDQNPLQINRMVDGIWTRSPI